MPRCEDWAKRWSSTIARSSRGPAAGRFDDVVLVLRGLAPYAPIYGQVSLCWLISHPEMMSRREAASYDRVFAASTTWSARMSEEWDVRIDPLLQATKPELFHPDRGRADTGHSVLFVGSSRKILRPLVGAAVEGGLPLSIRVETSGRDWSILATSRPSTWPTTRWGRRTAGPGWC